MFFCCSFIRSYNAIGLSLARTFFYLYTRVLFAWYQLQVRYTLSVLSVHTENHIELVCVCVRFSFFLCTCCVSHWTLARVLIHSHTYTGLQTRELISILHLINILHTLSPPPISIALYRLVISIFLVIYFAVEEKRQPKTETAFFQLAALTGCALCTWLTEHEWCTNCNGIRFFFISFLLLERLSVSVCHSPT